MDYTLFCLCSQRQSGSQAPNPPPAPGPGALFLSQAASWCSLLRRQPTAYPFLLPGAQDWPLDPWHLGQAQHHRRDCRLLPQLPSRPDTGTARGRAGSQLVSSMCSLVSLPLALPTMTGPSLSLTHLLTISGLLCYSACCLGELCVSECCVCARARMHMSLHMCMHCLGKKDSRKADLFWEPSAAFTS